MNENINPNQPFQEELDDNPVKEQETKPTPANENIISEEAPSQTFTQTSEEIAAKEESKFRRFLRKLIRWTVGLLIIFALGFLTAIVSYYQPARTQLRQATQDLGAAEETISSLNNKINDLNTEIQKKDEQINNLQSENSTMQDVITEKETHITVLKTMLSVNQATIALLNNKPNESMQALSQANELLQKIKEMLGESQTDNLDTIEQRLNLITTELKTNPSAALADMAIVIDDLAKLEADLFQEN